MYTGHFGLDDGPFHGKAEGQDVYIGSQQAAVIARLRKVLAIADTAVAVSGPVGVGKTTLVRRALADLTGCKTIIPVDRIRLEPDEVLDLLLSRFEVSRQPKGTIQRVAAFRRLLHERLAGDTRVFIVVEDAERVGVDALLELEALTATDSGEPVGANIVLMGAGELPGLLARPALARLRQRIRLRQPVAPFDEADVEGYMRHCLECAGGMLEQIFEPGAARIVYRYSAGIARVVDNLCESALVAAAEAGLATILPEFLQEVAENCGLEPQGRETEGRPDEPVPGRVEVEHAAADTVEAEAEAEAEAFAPPAPHVAPPKLALVEPLLRTADGAMPEAETPGKDHDLPDASASQPEVQAAKSSAPVAGDLTGTASEAAPVEQHADEWKPRNANVMISRLDEVLPELVEQLQSHAHGWVRTTADTAQRIDRSSGDSVEIPTLSTSMRIALLPVRPMEERPRTAESVVGDEMSAAATEPESVDAHPFEAEASETDESPALSEPEPERQPQAEPPLDTIAEVTPVDAAAEEVVEPEAPAEEPSAGEALSEESAGQGPAGSPAAAIASAAVDIADPEPLERAPKAVEARPDDFDGREPSAREAGIEPHAEASTDEESRMEEPADPGPLPAYANELTSPSSLVADESCKEATIETVALSFDEELMLAPDVATDVFAPAEKDDAVEAGEPELDALQAAIRAANAWQASGADGDEEPVAPSLLQPSASDLPEVTLDLELEKEKTAPNALDRWADELSKAKSLEDISDILAETIFGSEEVEAISAEIRAKRAAEGEAGAGAPRGTAPMPASRGPQSAAAKAPTPRPLAAGKSSSAATARPRPKAPVRPAAGNISMTLSQRIEMVNSLMGKRPIRPGPGMQIAEIVLAEQPDAPAPSAANGPESIEAQIDTAITQSRRILSEADLARLASSDDDDDDKGRRGLFGFFRRSSKT